MIVEIGVFIVCLGLTAFFGAKAAREAFAAVREQTAAKEQKTTDTEEQKKQARRARREMENFMSYDGRAQEDDYGD